MKRVNQYHFYQLGTFIHPLVDIKDEVTKGDVWIQMVHARDWLKYLLADSLTPLVTSRSTASKLIASIAQPEQSQEKRSEQ